MKEALTVFVIDDFYAPHLSLTLQSIYLSKMQLSALCGRKFPMNHAEVSNA
jgi:hypothetical protein